MTFTPNILLTYVSFRSLIPMNICKDKLFDIQKIIGLFNIQNIQVNILNIISLLMFWRVVL